MPNINVDDLDAEARADLLAHALSETATPPGCGAVNLWVVAAVCCLVAVRVARMICGGAP